MKALRKIFCILFLIAAACILFAVGYYIAVTKSSTLDEKKLLLADRQICIYDASGAPLRNTALFAPKQTTPIAELPNVTKAAFISTEDKRFFTHNGFDTRRIAKALLNNLKSQSCKEGASTISQQLIKNTHLSQEKTLKRKLREWKLTRQLEKNYTKDEILEKYLNSIYFGHNCFGLRAAAEFYFGKTPNELNLSDSAILAGLVKSPNNYSPFKNPARCQARKNIVLNGLLKNGYITETERKNAVESPLPTIANERKQNGGYLHFVFDELTDIAEDNGFTIGGNIQIFTYLDSELQAKIEKIANNTSFDCEKSIFVLDNQTHGFKACVSDIGNIPRLPGSLIKPLLVYAPAIEENLISPATPILDEAVQYGGYAPENYDKQFHGYVSARECVEKSLNIPAVKILSSLGAKHAVSFLEKMQLHVEQEDVSLALALGGMKKGFSLKEIMQAYSVFPNNGLWQTCGFISKIKINGKTLYQMNPNTKRIFSSDTACLMNDILKGVTKNGTAKKLRSLPFPIAAKTGTAGTDKGNSDAYALSYTTKDCVGVWLGNKSNQTISHTGGGLPCNLLSEINQQLYENYQSRQVDIPDFTMPKNIVSVSMDKISYYDTHTIQLADDLAPVEYRISELFKKECIPLEKSSFFSQPRIQKPTIEIENGRVLLRLDSRSPKCYEYQIEKYDYITHTTVYMGEYTNVFIDENIDSDKYYVYTITPYYKQQKGIPIQLPAITTKAPSAEEEPPNDWWEY